MLEQVVNLQKFREVERCRFRSRLDGELVFIGRGEVLGVLAWREPVEHLVRLTVLFTGPHVLDITLVIVRLVAGNLRQGRQQVGNGGVVRLFFVMAQPRDRSGEAVSAGNANDRVGTVPIGGADQIAVAFRAGDRRGGMVAGRWLGRPLVREMMAATEGTASG